MLSIILDFFRDDYSSIAAVAFTQATGVPNTDYRIKGKHYLYPIDDDPEFCGNPNFPWLDGYGYFGVNGFYPCGYDFIYGGYIYCEIHRDYGPSSAIYPSGSSFCVADHAYPGDTNNTFHTPASYTLSITNNKVSGNLANTNQDALVGAPVQLQANVSPSDSSGTFAWSFSAPVAIIGGATNSANVVYRQLQPGALTAGVTYNYPGGQRAASVNINGTLPNLSSFAGDMRAGNVLNQGSHCSGSGEDSLVTFSLGCYQPGGALTGLVVSASAQIPNITYVSDNSSERRQV